MNASEASGLIEAIADSLEREPDQFYLDLRVNVIEPDARNSGFASGSDVTGIKKDHEPATVRSLATRESSDVKIARAATDMVERASVFDLADRLRQMALELRATVPDQARVDTLFQSIEQSWAPDVIISVISKLLSTVSFRQA